MTDALQCVANGMGKVVHGIDAPLIARAPMFLVQDAVHGRITHDDVGGSHVNLHAQGLAALREFTCPHTAEQIQTFLRRTIPPRTVLAGLRQGATIGTHFILAQLIHVGQTTLDPVLRNGIALIIIIAGVVQSTGPGKAQPVNIPLNGLHVFRVFLSGVGIIKAKVAQAAVLFSRQEVHDQGFAVANVHVSVGFRREARVHLRIAAFL